MVSLVDPWNSDVVSDNSGPSDFLLGLPLTARLPNGSPTSVFLPRLLPRAPSHKEFSLSLVIEFFYPNLHLLAPRVKQVKKLSYNGKEGLIM